MFSTSIKRSVVTLGVVAGLLAAAGPASAMPIYMKLDGVDGVVAEEPLGTDASVGRENSIECLRDGTSNTVQFAETGRSDAKTPSLIAKGTQVGSEGVKAPTNNITLCHEGFE